MEETFRAFLLADAGVAAIVDDRVDWGKRSQATALPAIVLHLVSAPRTHTWDPLESTCRHASLSIL